MKKYPDFVTAVLMICFAAISSMIPFSAYAKWTYETEHDEMRNNDSYFASTRSLNSVKFDFPYHKKDNRAHLVIGFKNNRSDVLLHIESGQFICHRDCEVNIKFDDKAVESFGAVDSSNPNGIFIHDVLKNILNSKNATIEANFFHEGTRQFKFDLRGLKWDHKPVEQ